MCGLRHQQNVDIAALHKKPATLSLLEGFPMGKTLPPFSQLMDAEHRRWAPFTRALLQADQAAFDRLFDCAKLHIQAGVMVSRPWPFEMECPRIMSTDVDDLKGSWPLLVKRSGLEVSLRVPVQRKGRKTASFLGEGFSIPLIAAPTLSTSPKLAKSPI
jgi:hypothetical protein